MCEKSTNINNNKNPNKQIKKHRKNDNRDEITDQPLTLEVGGDGGKSYSDVMWSYKDENVMNGSPFMDNVTGNNMTTSKTNKIGNGSQSAERSESFAPINVALLTSDAKQIGQ